MCFGGIFDGFVEFVTPQLYIHCCCVILRSRVFLFTHGFDLKRRCKS